MNCIRKFLFNHPKQPYFTFKMLMSNCPFIVKFNEFMRVDQVCCCIVNFNDSMGSRRRTTRISKREFMITTQVFVWVTKN